MADLTVKQQEVLTEVDDHVVFIPERKSPDMTPELWEKRQILKELTYMDQIRMDVDFNARRLVFYSKNPEAMRIMPDQDVWPEIIF